MTALFPAVIKEIRATAGEITMTLDISPPDLSVIADLIDQEITISLSTAPTAEPQPVSFDDKPHRTSAGKKR